MNAIKPIGAKLIDKANDISAFTSDDETRFVLNGIHFGPDFTEATDGAILIRVPYAPVDQEDLPGISEGHGELNDCIIPAGAVKEAVANMKKAKLKAAKVELDNDLVSMSANDIGSERLIGVTPVDGNYPNTALVFPDDDGAFKIVLNPERLRALADYATKNAREGSGVVFTMRGAAEPVSFTVPLSDGRNAVGVLMPMRSDNAKPPLKNDTDKPA